MATYYGTYGQKVQYLASDPSDPQLGQVWYNSTSAVLKVRQTVETNAWASGGNLNTARGAIGGAGATKDTALVFGGLGPPAPTATGDTESYNGTSWTEVNNLNTARALSGGVGTQTSALCVGGDQLSGTTESWNGSTWTSKTDSPLGGNTNSSAGASNTNALFFGTSPAGGSTDTAYWNGTSWTGLASFNTARSNAVGTGKDYQAALLVSGLTVPFPTLLGNVESFNGTAWTEVNDVNTARRDASGAGTQTSSLFYGGGTPSASALTESWNGTSWTETTDLSTARGNGIKGGAGSNNSNALMAGGTPPNVAASEEWTGTETLTRTVTVS